MALSRRSWRLTEKIKQEETQFWVCPHCGGNPQSKNGKQFCSKCNVYL